ncbi:hypothetical protein BBO99_00007505 [Phytophthora kernoviae]|uniref:Dihydroorotate dehydrogenase (quinone), mitochondrial n=1 Tax=Phytophthora kernoviae TaxID=325452 RepID=A0A3R7FWP2_9STRA|nr:hypothetical protein BBI17_007427 [Phytophthora kernoviae]RLN76504.1 hypothetical protein BBO99_00007505 [Phytophthora kernoviae]
MMPVVRLFDPETAHKIAVQCARFGLTPKDPETDPELLRIKAFGLDFTNPLGIAAGFDKDGEAMEGMLDIGFGCVEIGSVTPKPQPGNPKPRVFRLAEDRGVINRYGFNSNGLEAVGARLERYVGSREKRTSSGQGHRAGVLGVNLGKNKTTEDAAADYVQGVHALGKYADYLVVNVSSPNTPGLRTLQGKIQLQELLVRVLKARDEVATTEKRDIPLLVKIAPDLTEHDKEDIAAVALELKLDGLVVSNTTLSRPETLKGEAKGETGGLSGLPVRDLSTKVLGDMYKLTNGQILLIGVGGVSTGQDAYDKIRAGASLVQMYSCLIYESPLAVPRAKKELAALLRADGYENVADAVGAAHNASIMFGLMGQYRYFYSKHLFDNPDYSLIAAGVSTGMTEGVLYTPFETIKVRMQTLYGGTRTRVSNWHVVKDVYSRNGLRGLYRGIAPTAGREMVGNAVYFMAYETTKEMLLKKFVHDVPNLSSESASLRTYQSIAFSGGCAGFSYWLATFPIDTVKSVLQADRLDKPRFSGVVDCCRKLYTEGGVNRFYRGITPSLVRAFPANAVTFVAFEKTMSSLNQYF